MLFVFLISLFVSPGSTSTNFDVAPCDPTNKNQIFQINTGANRSIVFLPKKTPIAVLDCNGCARMTMCHDWSGDTNPDENGNSNQWWNIVSTQYGILLQSNSHPLNCVTAYQHAYGIAYTDSCDLSAKSYSWKWDKTSGLIRWAANASLCLDDGTAPKFSSCYESSTLSKLPYCNSTLDTQTRVRDLIGRLTLNEKAFTLYSQNLGVYRLRVPPNQFDEAYHGVIVSCGKTYNGNTGCPTSFPHVLALSATFNRSLWRTIGTMISTEARGLNSQDIAGLFFWAPNMNLFRDPRWGRGQEVPGEDPFLTGEYVMHYSRGMQEGAAGSDSEYLKVVSTAKHYADYDVEGTYGTDRGSFNAIVTDQDQVDYYWPAFRAAVEGAHVRSVMCSYNSVNGIPSCGNDLFMNEVMRKQWQFDGFVVSDCGAVSDAAFMKYIADHFNGSSDERVRVALEGGCDVNCGNFYPMAIIHAVQEGILPVSVVDQAASRLFSVSIELGMLDKHVPYRSIDYKQVDTPEHRATAYDAAIQAIVLLKNEKNTLPLSLSTKVALIGPHFNSTVELLGSCHGENHIVYQNSPWQAFQRMGANIVGAVKGCNISGNDTSGFAAAEALAEKADVVVMFMGLTSDYSSQCDACEGEGMDRPTVKFGGVQLELIQAIKKPIILVLINGGAIDISYPKSSSGVPAILECWYPGQYGGAAIASIVYGSISPSGRLPTTIYDSSIEKARNISNMNLRANGGITYKYYTGTPVYPFGFGLSYTTFTYKWKTQEEHVMSAKDAASLHPSYAAKNLDKLRASSMSYSVVVTNVGTMAADTSVLGFITSSHTDAPQKELFDFARVHLKPGQSTTVHLSVSPEVISLVDSKGREYIAPGTYNVWIGDSEKAEIKTRLVITGESQKTVFDLEELRRLNKFS